jgi:hypothetical protein
MPEPPVPTLTDRVLARVQEAAKVADRRTLRRRAQGLDREARSLRRVFRDLGDSYRDYRRRTGEPVSPDIRAAAEHFRKEPNVTALVSVAASLDRLEILPW